MSRQRVRPCPLVATIRHALAFCLQTQNEISRREQLFHGQADNWVAQSIKDTLPYFLGAVDDEHVRKLEELRRLRDQLRAVDRQLSELKALRGDGFSRASTLMAQARDAGLAVALPESGKDKVAVLESLGKRRSAQLTVRTKTVAAVGNNRLSMERQGLIDDHQRISDEIALVCSFEKEEQGYPERQRSSGRASRRLGSSKGQSRHVCPLCAHALPESSTPATQGEIRQELKEVSTRLETVMKAAPNIGKATAELRIRLQEVENRLSKNRAEMSAVRASSEQVQRAQDAASRRAVIVGRISLYVENVPEFPDTSALERQGEQLREQCQSSNRPKR